MKKIICIILAAIMLTVTAFAASRTYGEADENKLNIVIDGGLSENVAVAGSDVAVRIKLVNNKAISSVKMKLSYDENLSVKYKSNGKPDINFDIFDSDDSSARRSSTVKSEQHEIVLNWISAESEVKGDCVFATIIFTVAKTAEVGSFLPITAEINPNDIFDINQKNIDYKLINGGVDVTRVLPGDVDGDGVLTNRDVMYLGRHLKGKTPDGFVAAAADYNGDGSITVDDADALFAAVSAYEYSLPEVVNTKPAEDELYLVIEGGQDGKEALIGERVSVTVKVRNLRRLSSLKAVVYWSEKLILEGADDVSLFEFNTAGKVEDWSDVNGSFAFNLADPSEEGKTDGEMIIAQLVFYVSNDASDGESLYVTAVADNAYASDGTSLEIPVVSGGVKAKEGKVGDPNNDGSMDNKDVVVTFRFVSGLIDGGSVISAAMDFNGDLEINNKDVVGMFRHLSSGK